MKLKKDEASKTRDCKLIMKKKIEVPNIEEQQKKVDSLNKKDTGSD
jgi:hypothetical protein